MSIRKAVIPVAGFGTRFLPATKAVPKNVLPVFDRPSIHFCVDEAAQAGIEEVILVVSRNQEAIPRYFEEWPELEAALAGRGNSSAVEELQRITSLARITCRNADRAEGARSRGADDGANRRRRAVCGLPSRRHHLGRASDDWRNDRRLGVHRIVRAGGQASPGRGHPKPGHRLTGGRVGHQSQAGRNGGEATVGGSAIESGNHRSVRAGPGNLRYT